MCSPCGPRPVRPRRRTLLLAAAGLLAVFMVLQVGRSRAYWDRRPGGSWGSWGSGYRRSRGLDRVEGSPPGPTGSNVVYITLRSRRVRPTRGAARHGDARTQSAPGAGAERARGQTRASGSAWRERTLDYRDPTRGAQHPAGTPIRIYSEAAPPWLSAQDVRVMRLLADAAVSRVREVSVVDSPAFLVVETEVPGSPTRGEDSEVPGSPTRGEDSEVPRSPTRGEETEVPRSPTRGEETEVPGSPPRSPTRGEVETEPLGGRVCHQGRCGVLGDPGDPSQVLGFHLDRVLGLNRTLPAVSRRFGLLHGGQPCPVSWWDPSLYPEGFAAGRSAVRLTWTEYQSALKHRCWHGNETPPPDWGCSSVHHQEWSRLALFDFLLQNHQRLDPACCGFRSRAEDVCVGRGQDPCGDQNHIPLNHILVRGPDPRRLVFTSNTGDLHRSEDHLDYRLLEGVQELPERAIEVLRSGKLRQRLLQSLFLDVSYWLSQGGRRGIERLIDVVEGRAKLLLTFITAHGVKVTAMTP